MYQCSPLAVSDHITFHSNMFSSRHGVDLACVLICLHGIVSQVALTLVAFNVQ